MAVRSNMTLDDRTADPLNINILYHYQNHLYPNFLSPGRSKDYHRIYN